EKIPIILDQAHKFRVGLILAHQRLDQLTPPVLSALYGSTAIKFAAQLSDANASAMARNMGTTPEFIASQPPYSYAVSVRGFTQNAVSLKIPFADFMQIPRMSDVQARFLRDDMRRKYALNAEPMMEMSDEDLFGTGDEEEIEVEEVEAEYIKPEKPQRPSASP